MAISDEILSAKNKLLRVRTELEALVSEVGASAGFLVDERGDPFAAVGHVEFRFPHPLAELMKGGADAEPLLRALVGETPAGGIGESRFLVERIDERALVVLVLDGPLSPGKRRLARARAGEIARSL